MVAPVARPPARKRERGRERVQHFDGRKQALRLVSGSHTLRKYACS
jgi:hypothetical protein